MAFQQARERQHSLMVARDAELAGRSDDARKVRASMPARNWKHERHIGKDGKPSGAIVLGTGAMSSCGEREVTMINPTHRQWYARWGGRGRDESDAYVLSFGAYGDTSLHVYADSLDTAIELAAGWLADHAPGYIMTEDSEDLADLRKEACEDAGLTWPMPADLTPQAMEAYWAAFESAEADLTHTESGYLTSYEFTLALENPTVEELYAFVWGV